MAPATSSLPDPVSTHEHGIVVARDPLDDPEELLHLAVLCPHVVEEDGAVGRVVFPSLEEDDERLWVSRRVGDGVHSRAAPASA